MFDLDFGKMLVFGAVALVVVGPKDLPRVLRSAGRILTQAQRLRNDLRRAVTRFADEADLGSIDRELATAESRARVDFALDPAMTMRGRPPSGSDGDTTSHEVDKSAPRYTSPEMAAYLAPPPEPNSIAGADGSRAESAAAESRPRRFPDGLVDGDAERSAITVECERLPPNS